MKVKALVVFTKFEDGGFNKPPKSGIRPQLKVGDVFTSCAVHSESDAQVFQPGREYSVILELLHWEQYKDCIYNGMPVQLNDGSRVVAKGVITCVELN